MHWDAAVAAAAVVVVVVVVVAVDDAAGKTHVVVIAVAAAVVHGIEAAAAAAGDVETSAACESLPCHQHRLRLKMGLLIAVCHVAVRALVLAAIPCKSCWQ